MSTSPTKDHLITMPLTCVTGQSMRPSHQPMKRPTHFCKNSMMLSIIILPFGLTFALPLFEFLDRVDQCALSLPALPVLSIVDSVHPQQLCYLARLSQYRFLTLPQEAAVDLRQALAVDYFPLGWRR